MGEVSHKKRRRGRSTLNDGTNLLDRVLCEAVQQRSGRTVSAFMLMSLDDTGGIDIHSSPHVKGWTDSIFSIDASEQLRRAHRVASTSGGVDIGEADHDIAFPMAFVEPARVFQRGLPANNPTLQMPSPIYASTKDSLDDQEDHSPKSPGDHSLAESAAHELDAERQMSPSLTQPALRMVSITIGNEAEVEKFLRSRLKKMQQLAVKKLAKTWIKGICPKKQGNFPYRNNSKKSIIPGWWPPVEVCRYKEPDHIKRSERLELCVHLLRLRPSPKQLSIWNNGLEPHPIHATEGWVQFLQTLAPLSSLSDMHGETKERTQKRQQLLSVVYDLAQEDENFHNGECDATDVFNFPDHDDTSKMVKKVRQTTAESDSESESEASEESAGRAKRRRPNPRTTASPARFNNAEQSNDIEGDSCMHRNPTAYFDNDAKPDLHMPDASVHEADMPSTRHRQDSSSHATDSKQQWSQFDMTYGGSADTWPPQRTDTGTDMIPRWPQAMSAASSFDMNQPLPLGISGTGPFSEQQPPPNRRGPPELQQQYHTFMMPSVPQPHFDTVPNTPVVSPNQLARMHSGLRHDQQHSYGPYSLPYGGIHPSGDLAASGSTGKPLAQQHAALAQPQMALRPFVGPEGQMGLYSATQDPEHPGFFYARPGHPHGPILESQHSGRGFPTYGSGAYDPNYL